jgi:hypothetical protein
VLRQGPPRIPANGPEFERALRALSVGTLAAAPPESGTFRAQVEPDDPQGIG